MPTDPPRAVFLSYASQDSEAAQRVCEALRSAGIEVWLDAEGGLEHGVDWDATIRRQIKGCLLFIPLISANTQARLEGYFRIEWDLAADRAQGIAQGVPFILPVVIDDTPEPQALVPDRFRKVQWTRLPGGGVSPELRAHFLKLWIQRTGANPAETMPAAADSPPRPPRAPGPPAKARRSFSMAWAAVAALGLALAALWVGQREGWLVFGSLKGPKQLAVLSFKNIGDTASSQSLSDGLAETITSQLTQLEQFQRTLLVVPMSEVRKETVTTASQARLVFGATLALTGSIQREENIVRVIVNLVDTRSLRILRSATLDSTPNESYQLQDRVAMQTASWLGLELSPEAKQVLAAGQTLVSTAYELYLRGRGELARRDIPGNLDRAVVNLQQALVSDPHYALAHAALGEAFWQKYAQTKDRFWIEEAKRSCNTALELGPLLAVPHVTLAIILNGTGQFEQAVTEAEKALRLDPANADVTRALARSYAGLNRSAEAEATFQRAIARNPDNGLANSELAVFYFRAGRLAEAEKQFLRVAELTPDNYAVYRNLGGLYVMMGRPEEAARLLEKSLTLKPSAIAYSNLGTLRFQQERYGDAAMLFQQASTLNPRDHVLLGNLADALRFIPNRAGEAASIYQQAIQLADEALLVNAKSPADHASVALYCAYVGNPARALDEIELARKLAPQNVPVIFNAVLVFERTGQRERALDALGLAIKGGYSQAEIGQHPDLKELRTDPRFASLISASSKTSDK